ncbi:hypothetical protein Tco_0309865 [Tanacetum coccineum]
MAMNLVTPVDTHGGEVQTAEDKERESSFADADHAGCQDTRRSTSGSIQLLGDTVAGRLKGKKRCDIQYGSEYIALSGLCAQHDENGVLIETLHLSIWNINWRDIFTKALGRERIEFLINKLGMRSFTPDTLKQLADEVDE